MSAHTIRAVLLANATAATLILRLASNCASQGRRAALRAACRITAMAPTLCGRLPIGKGFLAPLQCWLVRPCVRPTCAAHSAAGRNAIRVSGPDQKLALEVLGRIGVQTCALPI